MLPEITFSDGNKATMTDSDIKLIVNNVKTQWARRAKRPPTTLACYDFDAIVSKYCLDYLENKARTLAQKIDNESMFSIYIREMFTKGFNDNVRSIVDNYLFNAHVH
mgnify:CR=1 FL=1